MSKNRALNQIKPALRSWNMIVYVKYCKFAVDCIVCSNTTDLLDIKRKGLIWWAWTVKTVKLMLTNMTAVPTVLFFQTF